MIYKKNTNSILILPAADGVFAFCDAVTKNLNTDFTARRLLGYFKHMKHPSMEDVADEMLAILSDRAAIMKKKEMEATQARLNQIMAEGLGEEDD